nr:MAG TPA: hypothetical protein [Caudoviricetes sp.]
MSSFILPTYSFMLYIRKHSVTQISLGGKS